MLTQDQITSVWERQLAAEVRALYFGELASNYTAQKQWISGLTFFLSSGAAATVIAKTPSWVPVVLAVLTAVLTAYSITRGLDGATRTMSKLQASWAQLANEYEALWNSTWSEDAAGRLNLLAAREADLSRQVFSEAPYRPERVSYWRDHVSKMHHLSPA